MRDTKKIGEQETVCEALARDSLSAQQTRKSHRVFELLLVLLVGLGQPILASIYYLRGGTAPTEPLQQEFRIWSALVAETGSLVLLSYVLGRRDKGWQEIGWGFRKSDVATGIGVFIVAYLGALVAVSGFQYFYRATTGHFHSDAPLQLGLTVWPIAIALVCLNPFFEELIVRAFTMSEVLALSGSRTLAVAASVLLQLSYHLYQGTLGLVALVAIFAIFALYYAKNRRIVPVILGHFFYDVLLVWKHH
jgi:membrane protease YdiL (CAAX protease family)